MIDITLRIDKDHDVWNELKNSENKLLMAGHIGTHVDVYKKSEIPLNYFKTKSIIIDCTNYNNNDEIGLEVVKDIQIKENMFIIFKTNIQNNNPYGSEVYTHSHHELSWELIDYLLSKNVAFIGIDCAGVKRGKEHFRADVKCEENQTYIIENLDLKNVCRYNEELTTYTMWIDNPFATGLSTKVLIDLGENNDK